MTNVTQTTTQDQDRTVEELRDAGLLPTHAAAVVGMDSDGVLGVRARDYVYTCMTWQVYPDGAIALHGGDQRVDGGEFMLNLGTSITRAQGAYAAVVEYLRAD